MAWPTPAELREMYADLHRVVLGTEIDTRVGNMQPFVGGREKLTFRDEAWYSERRWLQFGADGSILQDDDWVFHVRWNEVIQIDYFDGMSALCGHAVCQLKEDEWDTYAPLMVRLPRPGETYLCGIINRRIRTIQRAWRQRWKARHHEDIIDLARFFVDLYARCREDGIILPSLDYEDKLAKRKYGSPWKEMRARQRQRARYEVEF